MSRRGRDLTRWNRAGLGRIQYVDGNAATFLEDLRRELKARFPDLDLPPAPPEAPSTERRQALEHQYQLDRPELLWQMQRALARATHVLAGYVDAIANESWIGTATQWESLRCLVALLDYAPRPPASAATPLVIQARAAGVLEAGFAVKADPVPGESPVVFETLSELPLEPCFNALYPRDHRRNPHRLSGNVLWLEEIPEALRVGEPVILEDVRRGRTFALRITGINQRGGLMVTPSLPHGFRVGDTLVHALPKERLGLRGPFTGGAEIGRHLRLAGRPDDIEAGDLVAVGSRGHKPVYFYVKEVLADGLRFHLPLGELNLFTARLWKPAELPVSYHGRRWTRNQALLFIVYVPGDWTRLYRRWLARRRDDDDSRRSLPLFRVVHANYQPPDYHPPESGEDQHRGYTALTLSIHRAELAKHGLSLEKLENTQAFLYCPDPSLPWRPDPWLEQSRETRLPPLIETTQVRKTGKGDFVVLQRGDQQAWGRVKQLETSEDDSVSRLRVLDWQDRGDGPFYLSTTTVYGHFGLRLRVRDWQLNDTPLSGTKVFVDVLPPSLTKGRRVLAMADGEGVLTRIGEIDPSRQWIKLHDPVPRGATAGNLVIHANVVVAGHGETRPPKVIAGEGGDDRGQRFLLEVADVSFVADSTQDSGVRAAIEVTLGGRLWKQVSHLRDYGPTDEVFTVRMTEDGYVALQFGDGVHGKRVPANVGGLSVGYRQGVGPAGNLPPASLVRPLRKHVLVEAVQQPLPASGGAAMEGAEAIRAAAPATVLTLERAVSLEDFAMLARSHSSVWQARAFSHQRALSRRDEVAVVVVPAQGATLTDSLKQDLQSWLLSHALAGVEVEVTPFGAVTVSLFIQVYFNPATHEAKAVEETVSGALVNAFALERRSLGQPLYRSELHAVVESVEGVISSRCEMAVSPSSTHVPLRVVKGDNQVIRLIDPGERQCVFLESEKGLEMTLEVWQA